MVELLSQTKRGIPHFLIQPFYSGAYIMKISQEEREDKCRVRSNSAYSNLYDLIMS